MVFWLAFAVSVLIICFLTWIGACMVRANRDTAWEKREDQPFFGFWGRD